MSSATNFLGTLKVNIDKSFSSNRQQVNIARIYSDKPFSV